MEIKYADKAMEKCLVSPKLIVKKYGNISDKLKNRLSELRAAVCLAEITQKPPPRRHKLSGDYKDCWGINVSTNWRIVVKPVGDFSPNDLTTVVSIKIITIEDYH